MFHSSDSMFLICKVKDYLIGTISGKNDKLGILKQLAPRDSTTSEPLLIRISGSLIVFLSFQTRFQASLPVSAGLQRDRADIGG